MEDDTEAEDDGAETADDGEDKTVEALGETEVNVVGIVAGYEAEEMNNGSVSWQKMAMGSRSRSARSCSKALTSTTSETQLKKRSNKGDGMISRQRKRSTQERRNKPREEINKRAKDGSRASAGGKGARVKSDAS